MKHTQEPVAPAHGAARRIHAIVPVVVGVSEALPQPFRSGIPDELPEHSQKAPRRGPVAFVRGSIPPPLPDGCDHADLRRRIHQGGRMTMLDMIRESAASYGY